MNDNEVLRELEDFASALGNRGEEILQKHVST